MNHQGKQRTYVLIGYEEAKTRTQVSTDIMCCMKDGDPWPLGFADLSVSLRKSCSISFHLFVVLIVSQFGFKGRILVLIVPVPGH